MESLTSVLKPLFIADMQGIEATYQENLNTRMLQYLADTVGVQKGKIYKVAPVPKRYFSKSNRFLVVQVSGHIARDKETMKFKDVIPAFVGMFLDEEGKPLQPAENKEGALLGNYKLETVQISGSGLMAKGFKIDTLASDQTTTVNVHGEPQ